MYSVVIIDDNKIAVEAIAKSTDWEKCGCRVAGTAYDGIAGLELIHDAAPDLSLIHILAAGTGNENVWIDSQNGVKDLSGNPTVVEAMEMFSKFASYKDAGDTAVDQTHYGYNLQRLPHRYHQYMPHHQKQRSHDLS